MQTSQLHKTGVTIDVVTLVVVIFRIPCACFVINCNCYYFVVFLLKGADFVILVLVVNQISFQSAIHVS